MTVLVAALGIGLGYCEALRQRNRAGHYLGQTLEALNVLVREATRIEGVEIPQVARARERMASEGLRYFRQISQIESDDPRTRSAQARALQSLADLHRTLGRPAEQEQALRESLALWNGLLASSRVERSQAMARCYLDLAEMFVVQRKRLDEAAENLSRVEDLASGLDGADRLRLLVEHRRLRARWLRAQQRNQDPRPLREAVQLAGQLLEHPAAVPGDLDLAASCDLLLGHYLVYPVDDLPAAVEAYQRGLARLETLAARSGEDVNLLSKRAAMLRNLGRALRSLGDRSEARTRFDQARSLYEQRVRDYPAVPLFHSELAEVIHGLAMLGAGTDPPGQTLQLLEAALEETRIAYQADPSNHSFAMNLLNKYGSLAGLYLDAGRHADAARAVEGLLSLGGRIYDFLFAARYLLGCEQLVREDPALAPSERETIARRYHARALAVFRDFIARSPADRESLRQFVADDAPTEDFRGSKPLQQLLSELESADTTTESGPHPAVAPGE